MNSIVRSEVIPAFPDVTLSESNGVTGLEVIDRLSHTCASLSHMPEMVEIKISSIDAEAEGGEARLVSKVTFLIEKAPHIPTPNVLQELVI